MSSVVSVPANEGVIIKKELRRSSRNKKVPEIVAVALKIKENNQKCELPLRHPAPTAAVYKNRAGRAVPLPTAKIANFNKAEKNMNPIRPTQNGEDIESIKGRFTWKTIGSVHLPCLICYNNGQRTELVSVRIAENLLLRTYMRFLHTDIYACISVKSHFMVESEAKLLNDMNRYHTNDQAFGKDPFIAGKECLVSLTDVEEFFKFLEVCYYKLMCTALPGLDKCGFIRINTESVLPYCLKDGQKYVPLFYFEGETDNLKHRSVSLKYWDLAYLKFCCKVQGIRNELFASDSCSVTSLEDIKAYFPPDTHFEEYWPAKVVESRLLSMQKSMVSHFGNSGTWIRAPPSKMSNISVPENNKHSLQAPGGPVAQPQIMPMVNSAYQNGGWPPNQIVHSYNIQTQPTQTRSYHAVSRNQKVPAQYYNTGLMIQQQRNGSKVPMINNQVPPPPLIRAGNASTSVTNNPGSYRSVTPMNQQVTTLYCQMTNNGVMYHSNQIRQLYAAQRPNSVHQQQQLQQHHQQHLIVPPLQQYSGPSSRAANTQQRNTLRNITAPTEIIDLSSPPSSPGPTIIPETNARNRAAWNLIRLPERQMWGGKQNTTNNIAAYQLQKTTLQGKTIHCINAKDYIHNALQLVSVEDVVKTIIPTSSVVRCVQILQKYLQTSLYIGNSEQIAMLHANGNLRSRYPDDSPLVMLHDVIHVLLQLKAMNKHDEQVQQYHNNQAKRQRISQETAVYDGSRPDCPTPTMMGSTNQHSGASGWNSISNDSNDWLNAAVGRSLQSTESQQLLQFTTYLNNWSLLHPPPPPYM